MSTTSACLLCGEVDQLGLPVCPDCGVTSPPVADTLLFVKPDPVHADRIRIGKKLEDLLTGHAHAAERKLVAAGHRALIRVPGNTAGRVLSNLADRGIPAVGRAARRVWASVPTPLYVIVAAVLILGTAAGLSTLPLFLWTSPLFAVLLLAAAQLRLVQPAIDAHGKPTRFATDTEHATINTLTSLPEGRARDLLAQLVQAARQFPDSLQSDEIAKVVRLACRAAEDLSDLEIGLLHSAGRRHNDRSQQLYDTLAERLRNATGVLHRLRAETIGLDPTRQMLAELIEDLELEADAWMEAKREVDSVLEEAEQ